MQLAQDLLGIRVINIHMERNLNDKHHLTPSIYLRREGQVWRRQSRLGPSRFNFLHQL